MTGLPISMTLNDQNIDNPGQGIQTAFPFGTHFRFLNELLSFPGSPCLYT